MRRIEAIGVGCSLSVYFRFTEAARGSGRGCSATGMP